MSTARDRLDQLRARQPRTSRYRVEGEVARGAMGAIYCIRDDDLDRTLAMKVMLEATAPAAEGSEGAEDRPLARFLNEARITARLEHPGIVSVHELGVDPDGQPFFTMALVDGETLAQVIERYKRRESGWTLVHLLNVILRACEAVAYAHARGVIHRDLKPDNIMVGQFGEVYVMDWGLAKELGRPDDAALGSSAKPDSSASPVATMDGDAIGTPSYMPPEQARGDVDRMGPPSDVFSIGAILYAVLAGHPPHSPEGSTLTPAQVLLEAAAGAPPSLRDSGRDIPAALVAICERAMAREPAARYPDMSSLAEALRAYLEGSVTEAREALRASRLLAGLHWLANIGWFLALCGLIGVVVITAITAFGSNPLDMTVPVMVTVDGAELTGQDGEATKLSLEDLSANLSVPTGSAPLAIAMIAAIGGMIGFMLALLHQLRALLASLRTGRPFTRPNVQRIRWIGAILLVLGVASNVWTMVTANLASALLRADGPVSVSATLSRANWELELDVLLAGLAVLILAEVFRVGVALEAGTRKPARRGLRALRERLALRRRRR